MRLSHSRASTFLRCPRKFRHLYISEREPRAVDPALSFGTAWHELMESRWRGNPPMFQVDFSRKLGLHEVDLLRGMYRTYCSLYPLTERVLETETGHVVSLGNDELEVRFDALVESDGSTLLVEHKTTSSDISPGSFYWERLQLDQQASWYYLAAQALGHQIDGIIFDVVRKPALRKTLKETKEQFTRRCVDAVANEPEKYFARELVTRTQRDLDEARNNFRDIASLILVSKFPMSPQACFDFNRRCEYHGVCTGEEKLSDDSLYQIRQKVV